MTKAAPKTALAKQAPAAGTPSTASPGNLPDLREPLIDPEIVDEFAPLLEQLRAIDAQRRHLTQDGGKFDTLNKQIRQAADTKPAGERLMLCGHQFDIEATPKENESEPNWKALVKDFGIKLVLKFCSITQKAVKQLLAEKKRPESEYESYFTKERTGSRKLSVVAKTAPAPASAKEAA